MSDLKLVAPDQPTPFERLLLNAAANESPSAEQRMRVRAALGLSAVAAPPPPVARVGRFATAGKAAIAGAIAVSAVVALVLSGVGRKPAAPAAVGGAPLSAPRPVPEMRAPATAAPVVSPLPPIEPASDSSASATAPKSTARSISGLSAVSKNQPLADGVSDLSEQLRLIDAARSAIAAGNTRSASQALSSYGAKFPRGSFAQEAAVLRIETVDMQGNHVQAASLARAFLAQHPNSPHVGLVQRIANRGQ
jgi:hypothetical protein